MGRLTKKFNGAYITNCDNCPKHGNCYDATNCRRVLVDMLAAYEDTGLEPEEVDALVKAQDDGRVVVLDAPRQPLVWGDNDHDTCLCPDCGEDLMGIPYGERRALLGDAQAQKECTAQGIALPCPCCNGRALVIKKSGTYPGMWSAVCGKCYIGTPWRASRKEAINDWNTRAKPPIGECGTCADRQKCEFGGVFELEGINGYCPLYKEAMKNENG